MTWALAALLLASSCRAQAPAFDWSSLEKGWRERILRQRAQGRLPLVDMLSRYNESSLGVETLKGKMEEQGVAVMALSPDLEEERLFDRSPYLDWPAALGRLSGEGPADFIPVPATDLYRVILRGDDPRAFLEKLFAEVEAGHYPYLGEFRFRSYPGNYAWSLPYWRTRARDDLPIDGPLAERVFAFSQEHSIPFSIVYDVDDRLLPPLERMLEKYPRARVVWRRLGQVNEPRRARGYTPASVRRLLDAHPNLYFDLSWTGADAVYLPTKTFSSVLWDRRADVLSGDWARLIADQPWRFPMALGLDPDTFFSFSHEVMSRRALLLQLPPEVRDIVAYRAAWKLLFGEDLR